MKVCKNEYLRGKEVKVYLDEYELLGDTSVDVLGHEDKIFVVVCDDEAGAAPDGKSYVNVKKSKSQIDRTLVDAVEACAAPPKPEWQRSADAHPNDLGRLVVPDVT